MGLEIRRVPEGWEHPRDQVVHGYTPMHDKPFTDAFNEWMNDWENWKRGKAEWQDESRTAQSYTETYGVSPDPDNYRPAFDNPDHYQIYETVSEGTPVSPVFATLDELVDWMVSDYGHTREQAESFAEYGSASSFIIDGGVLTQDSKYVN